VHHLTPLNAQLQGLYEPLSVHMGINSGLVWVGPTRLEGATGTRWTYTASGPVTNVAARLAALAEPGTILVGPETARRIAGRFVIREIGRRQLKNTAEEIILHQILADAAQPGDR
jgi:class 3 adenylate cyclase